MKAKAPNLTFLERIIEERPELNAVDQIFRFTSDSGLPPQFSISLAGEIEGSEFTVDYRTPAPELYEVRLTVSDEPGASSVSISSLKLVEDPAVPAPEYMDDLKPAVPRVDKPGFEIADGFPHVCGGSIVTSQRSVDQYRCWPFALRKNFQLWESGQHFATAQAQNEAEGRTLHFATIDCPQEWQGYTDRNPNYYHISGPQIDSFNSTATTEKSLFVGHLLHGPFQIMTNNIGATTGTVIGVPDSSDFKVGGYICVRDAGKWSNSEVMKVSGITSTGTTHFLHIEPNPDEYNPLAWRGFRSQTVFHPAGSYVTPLQEGNGGSPNLAYNFALDVCPKDANGNTYSDFRSTWVAENFNKTRHSDPALRTTIPIAVRGVYFDSDFSKWWMGGGSKFRADFDNDGIADAGIVGGLDLHLHGLIDYSNKLRSKLEALGHTNVMLWAGEQRAWPVGHVESVDFEAGPSGNYNQNTSKDDYAGYMHRYLAQYKASQFYNTVGPNLSFSQYIGFDGVFDAGGALARKRVKLQAAIDQIFGGWFSYRNFNVGPTWRWYDIFAVDRAGNAIDPDDYTGIRGGLGWLGPPVGYGYRVHDPEQWDESRNLLKDIYMAGMVSGRNTTIEHTPLGAIVRPIDIPEPPSSLTSISSSYAHSGLVPLQAGKPYTVCLRVAMDEPRCIQVRIGDDTAGKALRSNHLLTPTGVDFWHVLTFVSNITGEAPVYLDVGDESPGVLVENLKVFEGNAYVFRRDFEGGCIVANASPIDSEPMDLTGYKLVNSSQFPDHDGRNLGPAEVIPAHDAIFCVRTHI